MWAILSTICDNGVRSLWWRRRWHECSGCWGTLQMQTKLCIMYCNDSLVMDEHVQALVKNEISLFSEHTDSISSVNVIQQFTFYWLASICIPPQPFRLDRRKHVGQVKVINKAVQRHQLLPHMRHTKPLWEVLGGCRLFVACGDHSSSVWRDVTCSSTSHDQYTHTHAHLLPLLLSWLVRVIHFVEHLSCQRRNAVTGSLQIPTGGWECPHRYRRHTWASMLLPERCCCLMVFSMTYIPLLKILHIGPDEIMDH